MGSKLQIGVSTLSYSHTVIVPVERATTLSKVLVMVVTEFMTAVPDVFRSIDTGIESVDPITRVLSAETVYVVVVEQFFSPFLSTKAGKVIYTLPSCLTRVRLSNND